MQRTDIAFWDTSALVPLCCSQTFSVKARALRRKFPHITIWWGTTVEIHSALNDLSNAATQAGFAVTLVS